MSLRGLLVTVVLAGAGCETLPLVVPALEESTQELWEKGQQAMRRGNADEAIELYERSLKEDDGNSRNHMSLAAAYLARGNEEAACLHLARFVEARPDAAHARFYYAEVLLKRGQHDPARAQFEQVIAHAQDSPTEDLEHLLHCHGRLTEIAEAQKDEYTEHLHRGIGLYLLARCLPGLGAEVEMISAEALLFKSAGELSLARNLRPTEARPTWYLHSVWRRLGQPSQAHRWLEECRLAATTSYLSPAEHRTLEMAQRTVLSLR